MRAYVCVSVLSNRTCDECPTKHCDANIQFAMRTFFPRGDPNIILYYPALQEEHNERGRHGWTRWVWPCSLAKKRSKKDAAKRVVGAQRGHKINITIIIIFIITTNLCMCIHAFLCRPGRFGSRAAAGPPAKPHTRLCRCGEAVAVFLLLLAIHCAFFLH